MDHRKDASENRLLDYTEQGEEETEKGDVIRIERSTSMDEFDVPTPMPTTTRRRSRTLSHSTDQETDFNVNSINIGDAFLHSNPTKTEESHLPALSNAQQRQLQLNFNAGSQLRKLLLRGFMRWLITVILLSTLGGIMFCYSNKVAPMTDSDMQAYNFLVVGLSIVLGLNLSSSLTQMAVNTRWWILSLRRRSLQEVDLILHLDSLGKVIKLAFVAPRLAPACFLWVILCIAAQIGIAFISLCYSTGAVAGTALFSNGSVYVPDMSQISTNLETDDPSSDLYLQYAANIFGEMSLAYQTCAGPDDVPAPGTLWSQNSCSIFYYDPSELNGQLDVRSIGGNDKYWQYIFDDINADVPNIAVFTNRAVNATWICNSWQVTEGGDGNSTKLTVDFGSPNGNQTVQIPSIGGPDHSIFITKPDSYNCGSGCSTVHAFEASNTDPWWYECNITVGNVSNAILPDHEIGQSLAHMAAAGIALNGEDNALNGTQFQLYPSASEYGTPWSGSRDDAGRNMALFAIGVVATAAQWNSVKTVTSEQPNTGSQLLMYWPYITTIFVITAGLHLILFVVTSILSNLVIVRDDSAIATARLLRPIVDRLGAGGTSADSDEICKFLDDYGHDKVVYSVQLPQGDNLHYTDLGHQKRLRAFPEGDYA